jgi:hypothetical protein
MSKKVWARGLARSGSTDRLRGFEIAMSKRILMTDHGQEPDDKVLGCSAEWVTIEGDAC